MHNQNYSAIHHYQQLERKLNSVIQAEPDNFLLGTNTSELVDYYYSHNMLLPLKINRDRETSEIKKEWRIIPAHLREHGYQSLGNLDFEFELLVLTIPFEPNPYLKTFESFGLEKYLSGCLVKWTPQAFVLINEFKGYGFNKEEEKISREITEAKTELYQWVETLTTQITNLNESLKANLRHWIELRKEKLAADQERYASLIKRINIPLKRKDDEVVKRIQVDTKPLIQRVRPTPQMMEEYVIDRQKVLDILHIVDNQGRQLEKTPKSFATSGEEDLRNVLLVGLNTVFESRATGETFLANGKTDIYLNINKGNILVFECKIWGGRKLYADTIDQLLGYLTWRVNYGILITFCKQKSFTKILEESKTAIQDHPSYARGIQALSTTHLLSQHTLPTDEQKRVELHHLFYNLFC